MFDQQTAPQPLPPQPPTSPQVPPPVVEDMFARSDTPQSSVPSQGTTPAGGLSPVMSTGMPPVNEQELFGGRSFGWGKIVVIALVSIIVLAVIGVGAWFGFQYVMNQQVVETPTPVVDETPAPDAPSDQAPTQGSIDPVTPPEPPVVVDSDGDGLSDEEERQLGTDPARADTDIDGLTDRAEIKVYKTDPLNPDTDGDGYLDGDEVINGFDPLLPGSARLFQVPQN
jgi:hypothetical protein